jgi:hypothetical protein
MLGTVAMRQAGGSTTSLEIRGRLSYERRLPQSVIDKALTEDKAKASESLSAQSVHDRRLGCDPLCQNPWHQASALAHRVAGAATNEGRGHRARQQDRQDGVGDDG